MQDTASTSTEAQTSIIFADHLPLQLIKSEAIPPAPTRSESAIDWLPDLAGYSWIAYGASSLLVISHFPNPLSEDETLIGPIFRQIFELSIDGTGTVSAVSWSLAMPSAGDLAAALDNCIGLFSQNSEVSKGSFCWSQTATLVQSTKVEAIKWTVSGDGIITGGVEVFLWRKKGRSWGMAWKFRPELPQNLVSATWSIEGPSATAPLNKQQIQGSVSHINEASKCVSVCHSDGKFKYVKTELRHPLPISMIQWRPSTGKQSKNDARHPVRQVLLTCCVDGTVRLWSEIDDGRVRKIGYENNEHKTTKLCFRVAAVIEINQELNGTLGSDIFVRWAAESDGIINSGKVTNQYFSSEGCQHDKAGKCEWLVGFGPKMLVTFWAIHCLDDIVPLRFPRVTLWKRQEFMGPKVENSSLFLDKVVISRNQVFGPPSICSFVRSLPCNSLAWSQLYTQASSSIEDESLNNSQENLSCAGGLLNIDGHTGNILQVAVHSCGCEVEVAASLDTDGLVLFWSISTISNCIMGLPTLNPAWELLGKIVVQESYLKYTCLRWAPTILDEGWVIFAGHSEGVDCFIIKISEGKEKKMSSHKLCSIPFIINGPGEGPTTISSVPLPSMCKKTFVSNDFMLLALWKDAFKAFSWKITIHPCNFAGSCRDCSFDIKNTDENSMHIFESIFDGKKYCIAVDPCSSVFPDPHNHDQVTSYAVVCPTSFILSEEQKWVSDYEKCGYYSAYHMVTGLDDGTLKLWRSMPAKLPNLNSGWDLVGMLAAHEGPIVAISLTGCGRKIATICPAGQSNTSSTLHIWESVHLAGAGSFILEDTLFLDAEVISLNWLTMGNGQLLLGVCLQNELQVYAPRRCVGQNLVKSGKSLERNIWFCIALAHTYPPIRDFLWGPKATAVVVHNDYFCLFSQWLFLADKKHQGKFHLQSGYNDPLNCNGGSDKNMLTAIFTDGFKETSLEDNDKKCLSRPPVKMSMKNEFSSSMLVTSFQQKNNSDAKLGYWNMLDVAEMFGGSLPVYHPEALLDNICSGNWKRAYVALRHLVECLTSTNASVEKSCSTKSSSVIPPVHLSNYLEGLTSTSNKAFQWSGDASLVASPSQLVEGLNQFGYSWGADATNGSFTSSSIESELSGFVEPLEKLYDFAAITNTEKMQILAIIDLLLEISNQHSASAYESLDEPGQRFWVAVRFQQLYFVRRFGRLPSVGELVIDSGMIGWAFHSDCQENLFDSLLPNEPSWHDMQKMGVGFWYKNATQLRSKMEKLARQQYLKHKDPKACALLYIALNRLQVLAGLFKISKDDKDKPLVGFLSRNFQDAKNKAAALKNAYFLLGRHQVELAIAFFLLGGDTTSAITVCAKNLGDKQLALVICRLVEGYGGLLERHLVSKLLLPSAIENADYWFASFLEWLLGNHSRAFLSMLGVEMDSLTNKSALLSNHVSFLDTSIGQYCLMLATKSSMKNAVGECNAAILGRWAILMSASALKRCGLPLEALACLSSSLGSFGGSDQGSVSDTANAELLNKMLRPSAANSSSNWISSDVAFQMELHAKLDLAMQYISKLLREHPNWPYTSVSSPRACTFSVYEIHHDKTLLEDFEHKLITVLAYFEQKFSLIPLHLINRIVISLCNNGLAFFGYHILQVYISKDPSQDKRNALGDFFLNCILPNLLLKTAEEISYLFSRYIVACSLTCSELKSYSTESCVVGESKFGRLAAWGVYVHDLIRSIWILRAALKLFCVSCAEDFTSRPFYILDLCEYYVYFASTWLQGNHRGVVLIVKPHLITTNGHASYGMDKEDLHKRLPQIAELFVRTLLTDDLGDAVQITKPVRYEQHGDIGPSIPEDERWQIIGASLWGHMSGFLKHHLDSLPEKLEQSYSFRPPCKLFSFVPDSNSSEPNSNDIHSNITSVSVVLSKFLKTICVHICSYRARQFASFLLQKVVDGLSTPTLLWLEEFSQTQSTDHHKHFIRDSDTLDMLNNENELSASEILWDICADPNLIYGGLSQENSKWSEYITQKHSNGWNDVSMSIMGEREAEEREVKDSSLTKKVMPFQTPKEVYKRNGELLEALCINSVDQQQAALASNKKGIIFFSWKDGLPCRDKSNYVWAEADWPQNGWAGCESTPVPTRVSPGVGLGSKKGAHIGLGGATVGVGSLARTGRDLMGGEALGIPGYAGIGAAVLGWGIQEDFEEFVDPPATVENITTRAFSSHPSRPFFLVGSSNTHVYLWEFGKDKATATYGVLPAANVPPPFALASISSVQFDHCGHRFATAALDGTLCTWQLEVGGRSNVRSTESSLCFNSHALDVTYVTASGSIIAAAGYSSNGANVVIWDTLAPPTTSQASIMCHEGGAHSLCVFDNDIGSGSISPLIVTGGKGGDVGLHDFRYVATGKAKRHRHSNSGEQNINASTADTQNKTGDQNANGMLWYMPKAHSGSVTKIATIPNTSFFLTGSKDGDVKLWDAKRANLVYHWPKLHERRTFLQPSSLGFGGVVRAAVTDVQVVSHGFLTCGGDGSVKLIQLKDFPWGI